MSRAASSRVQSESKPTAPPRWFKELQGYLWRSELPLTALVFLLPMICLYEVGTRYFASDWVRNTETRVLAFNMMRQFLELFGATGKYLPCLAVVGILLVWHIARGDKWELHLGTASLMSFESVLLAVPLVAMAAVIGQYMPLLSPANQWKGGVVLALGAGIYEELVFRLIAFTLANIILVDLLRVDRRGAYPLIVVGSALLFSAYHYWGPNSSPIRLSDFVFRSLAGVYFGILFVTRGFGVTAGSHAAYDIYYFTLRALTPV